MIKKGIKVKILVGKDKKKEGEVIEIDRKNKRAKITKLKKSFSIFILSPRPNPFCRLDK